VRFNFENHRQTVADIHRAGVFLARFGQKGTAVARQSLDQGDGVFVGAVLRPHHRVNAQFRVVRFPAEGFLYLLVLLIGQSVGLDHFRCNDRLLIVSCHHVSLYGKQRIYAANSGRPTVKKLWWGVSWNIGGILKEFSGQKRKRNQLLCRLEYAASSRDLAVWF